jgi:CubicO group peptidase (beta-lactamase class C family)
MDIRYFIEKRKVSKIRYSLVIFFIVLFCFNNDLIAQDGFFTDANIPKSTIDTLKKYALTYPDKTQFSVAIIKNGAVNFIGVKKNDGLLVFVENKDSVFEIGSITKVFTSTILVNLILQDKINPDEPISKVLPFKLNSNEENARKITFKTLANHTSGLPNYPSNLDSVARLHPLNPYVDYDSILLKDYLVNEMTLSSIPGDRYEYSNLGYGILGYLLELKTGKSYEDLLKEYVFQKYGMNISTTNQDKVEKYLVQGHDENGEDVPNWDLNIHRGAGAVLSSANNLARFVMANFSNDPVLKYQRQLTFKVENNDLELAYGWHVYTKNGAVWYFHNGRTGGYRSNITMDLEKKNAIILLVNSVYGQSERPEEKISWKLLRTIE